MTRNSGNKIGAGMNLRMSKSYVERILSKIIKKDKETYGEIKTKIKEIINSSNPEHYKNLRKPLQKFKRVHIKKSFVLVFSYDKQEDFLCFIS